MKSATEWPKNGRLKKYKSGLIDAFSWLFIPGRKISPSEF